ncbi:unnamed protein product [Amoebophrya sp. A25]|nr:unnamed protein product [Amoebophrya sp. A25]|eukprot:GSA25T00007371001.1
MGGGGLSKRNMAHIMQKGTGKWNPTETETSKTGLRSWVESKGWLDEKDSNGWRWASNSKDTIISRFLSYQWVLQKRQKVDVTGAAHELEWHDIVVLHQDDASLPPLKNRGTLVPAKVDGDKDKVEPNNLQATNYPLWNWWRPKQADESGGRLGFQPVPRELAVAVANYHEDSYKKKGGDISWKEVVLNHGDGSDTTISENKLWIRPSLGETAKQLAGGTEKTTTSKNYLEDFAGVRKVKHYMSHEFYEIGDSFFRPNMWPGAGTWTYGPKDADHGGRMVSIAIHPGPLNYKWVPKKEISSRAYKAVRKKSSGDEDSDEELEEEGSLGCCLELPSGKKTASREVGDDDNPADSMIELTDSDGVEDDDDKALESKTGSLLADGDLLGVSAVFSIAVLVAYLLQKMTEMKGGGKNQKKSETTTTSYNTPNDEKTTTSTTSRRRPSMSSEDEQMQKDASSFVGFHRTPTTVSSSPSPLDLEGMLEDDDDPQYDTDEERASLLQRRRGGDEAC